jgi:hypothetical protein
MFFFECDVRPCVIRFYLFMHDRLQMTDDEDDEEEVLYY